MREEGNMRRSWINHVKIPMNIRGLNKERLGVAYDVTLFVDLDAQQNSLTNM